MRAVFLLLALLAVSVVAAYPPAFPHQLYGDVEANGAPAEDGLLVIAKINGTEFARTTTKGGKYGYDPVFVVASDNPETAAKDGGVSGDVISLYVWNTTLLATTVRFEPGVVTNIKLDVDFAVPCQDDCVAVGSKVCSGKRRYAECGNWDGDACLELREEGCAPDQLCREGACVAGEPAIVSAPVEGLVPATPEPPSLAPAGCVESWLCDVWGPCVAGRQYRGCTDFNACGTALQKPATSQPCVEVGAPSACVERWDCTPFGPCIGGTRSRSCADLAGCGTQLSRPSERESCPGEVPPSEEAPAHIPAEREVGGIVLAIIVVVALVVLAGGITYWLHERAKSESAVRSYILAARQKGYRDPQIKAALMQAGWQQDIVEASFKKVK